MGLLFAVLLCVRSSWWVRVARSDSAFARGALVFCVFFPYDRPDGFVRRAAPGGADPAGPTGGGVRGPPRVSGGTDGVLEGQEVYQEGALSLLCLFVFRDASTREVSDLIINL